MSDIGQPLLRIAVFASGSGTNARELMSRFRNHPRVRITLVVTNRPEAGVIDKAGAEHVPVSILRHDEWNNGDLILSLLGENQIDLVILAGYLKKIPDSVIARYRGRMLNIHPSLLPKFGGKGMYGRRVHEAVIASGMMWSGITIHLVTEEYDEGPPVFQHALPLGAEWNAERLEQEIHKLEHRWFPPVVERFAEALMGGKENELTGLKKIETALVSVYHKDGLDDILRELHAHGVHLYSTGGTADHIRSLGIPVTEVSDITGFPSILDGRVKTLHPAVFGGILARRDSEQHRNEVATHNIPFIDLVIVDLYPFADTVNSGATEQAIIEKIDIGGISLIRAAAKNFNDVAIVPSQSGYASFLKMYREGKGMLSREERKHLSGLAFRESMSYDARIAWWMTGASERQEHKDLRYGENPHQKARFIGDLDEAFEQLHGKELSYNNIVDIDAALELIDEFREPVFAIIKHTNPCGVATGKDGHDAWKRALECDPLSAFGGILATNQPIGEETAREIDSIFYEVLIAPAIAPAALELLSKKKNRILLIRKEGKPVRMSSRTALNGILEQDKDTTNADPESWEVKTSRRPTAAETNDMLFGEKVVKHLKSNAIALVRNGQLIGSGMGQTSRIDALRQSVEKARERGFQPEGSILASDAFFPFSDSARIAKEAGITAIVQPGGSVKDQDTVDFCEQNGMCLVFTHIRHFKH